MAQLAGTLYKKSQCSGTEKMGTEKMGVYGRAGKSVVHFLSTISQVTAGLKTNVILKPSATDENCWMLHVAPVCTSCYMLLGVVAQSLKPVKLLIQNTISFTTKLAWWTPVSLYSYLSQFLQKLFIVNHLCAFTSRSEMKRLTQALCNSNALTFPKCSTNRLKSNSFITMPFHL